MKSSVHMQLVVLWESLWLCCWYWLTIAMDWYNNSPVFVLVCLVKNRLRTGTFCFNSGGSAKEVCQKIIIYEDLKISNQLFRLHKIETQDCNKFMSIVWPSKEEVHWGCNREYRHSVWVCNSYTTTTEETEREPRHSVWVWGIVTQQGLATGSVNKVNASPDGNCVSVQMQCFSDLLWSKKMKSNHVVEGRSRSMV